MVSGADQFAALSRIAGLVDAPGAFEQIAPVAASSTRTLVSADGAWLCVRRRRHADLVLRHADGIEPRTPHSGDIPIAADVLVETAALAGGTLRIDDYESHETSDPHLRAQGVRAVLAAPLVAGTLDQGVLIVFRRDGPFPAGSDTLLSQAAQTLALVLATHEARRAHGQALAREQLLARAANETAAAPDIEIAMRHTAEGAAGVADAVFAAVLLGDGPRTRLVAATGDLLGSPRTGLAPLPSSLGRGRPQLYIDAVGLIAQLGVTLPPQSEARGRLCVLEPIADGADVFGAVLVLLAADAPDPSVFGSLETLACNAGGVLRRSRLHTEVEGAYLSTVTALANALEAKDLQTQERAERHVAPGRGRRPRARPVRQRPARPGVCRGAARCRQDRDPRRDPRPPRPAQRRGVGVRPRPHGGRRADPARHPVPAVGRLGRALRPRAVGRRGLSGRPGRRADPAAVTDRVRLRHLGRDDLDRPYREALTRDEAERRLGAEAGHQLDPQVVSALLAVVGRRDVRERVAA